MSRALERFPDLPAKMRSLPVDHRGFPVPWFVAWVDGEPHFPVADQRKMFKAVSDGLCWVCGGKLGRISAFVIGPMCAINLTSSEPPSHLECARFSAKNCPFLTKPRMKRVGEENLPCGTIDAAGIPIRRNPGVTLVWATRHHGTPFADGRGLLFNIGEPHFTEWWSQGRPATRIEVQESVITGLPALQAMCEEEEESEAAFAELKRRVQQAVRLLPA